MLTMIMIITINLLNSPSNKQTSRETFTLQQLHDKLLLSREFPEYVLCTQVARPSLPSPSFHPSATYPFTSQDIQVNPPPNHSTPQNI